MNENIYLARGPVLWVAEDCRPTTWQALIEARDQLTSRLTYPLTWITGINYHVSSSVFTNQLVYFSDSSNQAAWFAQMYLGDTLAHWVQQANSYPHLSAIIIETVDVSMAQEEPEWRTAEQCLYWPVEENNLARAWSQALFFMVQSPTVRASFRGNLIGHQGVWRIQGPHHSSYSLALVNRSLALGLQQIGVMSSLWDLGSTNISNLEAFDKYIPDEICALSERGVNRARDQLIDEVVLYNNYPVNVWSLNGAGLRVLANYAWEESAYPQVWVDDMNAQLDLITVVTPLVKKILRDQGVRVPIAVVGNAVNHWQEVPAQTVDLSAAVGFRFLHVSSGLARKGVDVLLKAYGQAFRAHDEVTLIIKTVSNPDNQCAQLLDQYQARDPQFPRVILIDKDWNEGQMKSLYSQVQVVVMPSRAEGFGLPAAEAIWQGVPVIVTGFGGQVSLSSKSSMGLIDYDFLSSKSHLGLVDSVWVEPRVDHLASLMKTWFQSSKTFLQQLARQAQKDYAYPHSWSEVAQLTQQAVDRVRDSNLKELPEIAWVTTWNSPCGIATYSENLSRAFGLERLRIYANRDAQALEDDAPHVLRCWRRGQEKYNELVDAILAQKAQIAIVQSQPGLMPLVGLCDLLSSLQAAGIATYVTLHNTRDWFGESAPRLRDINKKILAKSTRLLVHTLKDLNCLKQAGFVDNVTYFPHGIYDKPDPSMITSRQRWQIPKDSPVIATFGFLMPHKGQQILLEALAKLRPPYSQTHLLMLNTVLAEPSSQIEWQSCCQKIKSLGLENRVHSETSFLPESVALQHLSVADVIVFPYQYTDESASGAVRMGLATGKPVAVTPLSIFDDVAEVTYPFDGVDANLMARGIEDLLNNLSANKQVPIFLNSANRLVAERNWNNLSLRLKNLVEGQYFDLF